MTSSSTPDVHLDTSFLIRALVPGSVEGEALRDWLRDGCTPAISALAWGEFLCGQSGGPLEDRVEHLGRRVVRRRVPVSSDEAREAARLFNETGRRRGSFADCIIAATALTSGAVLATNDRVHFSRFSEAGLQLVEWVE